MNGNSKKKRDVVHFQLAIPNFPPSHLFCLRFVCVMALRVNANDLWVTNDTPRVRRSVCMAHVWIFRRRKQTKDLSLRTSTINDDDVALECCHNIAILLHVLPFATDSLPLFTKYQFSFSPDWFFSFFPISFVWHVDIYKDPGC